MKDNIVLVDDNKELLALCSKILELRGFKVMSFTNVDEAKKHLYQVNVEKLYAIVSDLMMAPNDGLDFLSHVKSVPALAHIDFYLMTGAAVTVFEPFYSPYVIKGIIEKPFNMKTFVDVLTGNAERTTIKFAA